MTKPTLDGARAEQNLAEPRTKNNEKFKLSEELLKELRDNAYNGRVEENVIGRISKFLEVFDLIKTANVESFELRMKRNNDKMCDDDEEGRDPFEFIPWMNSKFKDHKKVDDITKQTLLYSWIEDGNRNGLMNDVVSSDEEWEESDYGNPPKTNTNSLAPYFNDNSK
ncbi:hypothetical protein Tco_0879996 [Tanacetum coccineum]